MQNSPHSSGFGMNLAPIPPRKEQWPRSRRRCVRSSCVGSFVKKRYSLRAWFVLRKNKHAVRSDVDQSRGGESIPFRGAGVLRLGWWFRFGGHIGARLVSKGVAIALPVAVEPQSPRSRRRKSQPVILMGNMREIRNHHHIITGTALVPTMIRNHVIGLILMEDVQSRSQKTSRRAELIETQMNQVPIHPHQAAELLRLVPVQRNRILEPAVLQEFLSLKQHRYAWRV